MLLLLLQAPVVPRKRVVVSWDVGYVDIDRTGYGIVQGIGSNGVLPIPPVILTVGDTLALTVRNLLNLTTLIHAHGLFQRGTSYMDGAAMATQCGIPPGLQFTYDGFGLINGVNGKLTKPMHFQPSRTYRLRLVNMSAAIWFQFSLSGHVLRVVEINGEYTEPLEVGGVEIASAQRYSVLLTAHSTNSFNYRYNITMYASFNPAEPGISPRIFIGDIIYQQDAPFIQADAYDNSFRWAKDIELHALAQEPALSVGRSLELTIGRGVYSTDQNLDHFNNITYALPLTPALYTALSMGNMAMDERVCGPQAHVIVLMHNEVIELVIHNPESLPHPLHSHGHAFQITEYGPTKPFVPNNVTAVPVVKHSGVSAKRDTVVVLPYQYVKLRFRADNPGVWMLHCHMDIHFVICLALAFIEAPGVLQKTQKVLSEMLELCAKQGIKTTGNAAGNQGLNFTGLPSMPTIVLRKA
ncbi:ferroxidase fet3 [Coemansia sp. S146]|nr:ferroxidase fet3 [Coemansia sp. S146]